MQFYVRLYQQFGIHTPAARPLKLGTLLLIEVSMKQNFLLHYVKKLLKL